jgi:hypothetical protein
VRREVVGEEAPARVGARRRSSGEEVRWASDKMKNEACVVQGREKRKHPYPNPLYSSVNIGESYLSVQHPLYSCGQTDEYRGAVKVKRDNSYIRQFWTQPMNITLYQRI